MSIVQLVVARGLWYQEIHEEVPVELVGPVCSCHPEMALHEIVLDVEKGLPVVTMNCSFVVHVISETRQLHQIICRTVGLKEHVQVSVRLCTLNSIEKGGRVSE